jgi:hypothetical protein
VSKKLIVIGRSNNFLNEVRRIETKMYSSETVGAAVAHFSSTTTEAWIFSMPQSGTPVVSWQ